MKVRKLAMTAAQERGCEPRKLCKDCRYGRRSLGDYILLLGGWDFAKCMHPAASRVSGGNTTLDYTVVNGKPVGHRREQLSCVLARTATFNICGPEGKLWTPRSGK